MNILLSFIILVKTPNFFVILRNRIFEPPIQTYQKILEKITIQGYASSSRPDQKSVRSM